MGPRRAAAAVMAVVSLLATLVVPAGAVQTTLPNSEQPLPNTARVMDGYIYDIDRVGDLVVVAGEFSTVRDYAFGSPDQTRNFIFAYDQSTGEVSQTFVPVVDDIVHAVHITDGGDQVLVAGRFRTVNGTSQRGIARLDLDDGSLDPTWTGQASSGVLAMAVTDDEVVVGGWFDRAGGLNRPRLAALDPETGQGIVSFDFDLQGVVNPSASGQLTQVIELDASPDGRWLGVLGNQTSVDGQPRGQIALIDLDDHSLAGWRVPELGTWPCSGGSASITYVLDIGFSPDSSYLVSASKGAYANGPDGYCDTVARFELPPTATGAVRSTWRNYTGGDSLFQVAVTDAAVYAGGHQRWANNAYPTRADGDFRGDRDGPGSVERYGLAALDPTTGVPLSWFPNRDGARPRRGFQAIEPIGDRLHLGSDSLVIGGEIRQRVAAYGLSGGPPNPAPEAKVLPASLYVLSDVDGVLDHVAYDGRDIDSAPDPVSGPGVDGVDWTRAQDGFLQHGELVYFTRSGRYSSRPFDKSVQGGATVLSQTVGYVDTQDITVDDQPFGVEDTEAAAYVGGRILYTRDDSPALWWRWYSTESGIIGAQQYLADDSRDWREHARAMTVIADRLYVATRGGRLVSRPVRADHTGVTIGSRSRVEDDGTNGVDWADVRLLFSGRPDDTRPPDPPPPPGGGSGARFRDVPAGSTFADDISRIAAAGITRGCNPPANDRFCPGLPVTRQEMAAFIRRAEGLRGEQERFRDVSSSNVFARDIGAIARAGITRGCNPPANDRFCPRGEVTRQEMAAFVRRGLGLSAAPERFRDVSGSNVFATDIGAMAAAGITRGCNPPANDRFCPRDVVTREQMAAFLVRGWDL